MKLITITALAGLLGAAIPLCLKPQDAKPESRPAPFVANPKDVESVDAILAALYDVISGPAGQERDWNRMRSLFIPEAHLVATQQKKDGTVIPLVMTPDDYAKRAGPSLVKDGFFEREIARKTESFGVITHVFSTYESRIKAKTEPPIARGINSIQLMKDKDRWWVVSIFWCGETPKHPLPPEYLPK